MYLYYKCGVTDAFTHLLRFRLGGFIGESISLFELCGSYIFPCGILLLLFSAIIHLYVSIRFISIISIISLFFLGWCFFFICSSHSCFTSRLFPHPTNILSSQFSVHMQISIWYTRVDMEEKKGSNCLSWQKVEPIYSSEPNHRFWKSELDF